jgi:DNA-binding transcriptional LysR family regulator
MNYTLHQLFVFKKIAELKSITKAAEELHMTQPAVSIQLKNLQDQFDIPLTTISGRNIKITDFGKEVAAIAEQVLIGVEELNRKSHDYKGLITGKLKIASVSTGKYIIPYFLRDFLKKHEGIDLNLDVTNRSAVIASLDACDTDYALVSVMPDHGKWDYIDLMDNELYLVGSKNYAKKNIVWEKESVIYRELGSATRNTMQGYIENKKIRPKKILELQSNEAVKQAVIAGIGISVIPLIGMKRELKLKELEIIPMKGFPIKTKWRLIWRKEMRQSPLHHAFVAYIRENSDKIASRFLNSTTGNR